MREELSAEELRVPEQHQLGAQFSSQKLVILTITQFKSPKSSSNPYSFLITSSSTKLSDESNNSFMGLSGVKTIGS